MGLSLAMEEKPMTLCRSIAGLAILVVAILTPPAAAAVRQCGPVVSSEVVTSANEQEARKGAVDQWRAKAAKLGPDFDNWILAATKNLKCFPKPGGTFECIAFGAPCVIEQNPNRRTRRDQKGVGI